MFKRHFSLALIAVMLVTMAAMPAAAQNPLPSPAGGGGLSVPITGNAQQGGRITGTFTILRFVNMGTAEAPQLGAMGTLSARTARGDTLVSPLVLPVVAAARPGAAAGGVAIQQVCEILDLTLGPLDLNLAGLEVHLDTVHLLIEANPAGGLLGQLLGGLLCGLDLGGLLGNLAASLTQVLGILNGIIAILSGIGL